MYARVVTSQFKPDNVNEANEALAIVRNSILPAAKSQKGFKGYLLLGDQTTGKTIGITFGKRKLTAMQPARIVIIIEKT